MVELAISVMTDEFSSDLEKVAAYLVTQNVKYIELRGIWKTNVLTMDDATVGRIKDICKQYQLKVASISGGLLKCVPPSMGSKSDLTNPKVIDRALEVAKILDAPYIRCFGFHGKWPVPPVQEWDSWPVYQEWRSKISEAKEKAAVLNKSFICENEGGLDKSHEHIERIGADNCGLGFGILYDMANAANKYGKNGVLTDAWLSRIAKYFRFIHAKGCRQRFLFRGTSFINGPGDICRWPQVIAYLRKMTPAEFVIPAPQPLILSVETHMGGKDRWQNSHQCLQNLRQLVENP